jgi:hypothetical protein
MPGARLGRWLMPECIVGLISVAAAFLREILPIFARNSIIPECTLG